MKAFVPQMSPPRFLLRVLVIAIAFPEMGVGSVPNVKTQKKGRKKKTSSHTWVGGCGEKLREIGAGGRGQAALKEGVVATVSSHGSMAFVSQINKLTNERAFTWLD